MEIRGRKKDPFHCLKHKVINIPNRHTLAEHRRKGQRTSRLDRLV